MQNKLNKDFDKYKINFDLLKKIEKIANTVLEMMYKDIMHIRKYSEIVELVSEKLKGYRLNLNEKLMVYQAVAKECDLGNKYHFR